MAADILTLLTEDAVSIFGGALFGQQWGLFLDGAPVIIADNVVSFDYRKQYSVSDYPVEEGSFESYDKVELPADVRMTFSTGGSVADREAFLASCQAIVGDFNLYDAVSPEAIYPNMNVTHLDYRRTAQNGMGLMVVNLWLLEIRQVASAALSNTKDPSAAAQVNGGTVQPTAATATQAAQAQLIAGPAPGGPGTSR